MAKDWLPETAFRGPASVAKVAAHVDDWSGAWLASGRLKAAPEWRKADRLPDTSINGAAASGRLPTLNLRYASQALPRLASARLGRAVELSDLRTAADKALLEELVRTALSDLDAGLKRIFLHENNNRFSKDGVSDAPHRSLSLILDEREEVGAILIAEPLLIAAARHRAGTPRPRPTLMSRARAIEDETIAISAVIGRNRIPLRELAQLGVGDVIALDTQASSLLDIKVGPHRIGEKAASIHLAGEHLHVHIEKATSEW